MVKICVVKSCPSGRKRKYTETDEIQSPSFFRPTTPERLESWKMSLGIDLKYSHFICHLHFKEEDIDMYEKFYINGELQILLKGRKILKDGALPTIGHQFVPIPALKLQASVIHEEPMSDSYYNQSKDEEQDQVQKVKIEQQGLLEHAKYSQNLEQPLLCPQGTQSMETFKDNFLKFPALPPSWLYVDKPNGLEFMRMDPITKQMKNHIRINQDLSITVVFANNEELSLNEQITSSSNAYDYLKTVERWPLCVGTQFDNNKYSKLCKGLIDGDDAYKRNRQYPRCKSCRILRNRLQNSKSATKTLDKTTAKIQSVSNLARQCKRLKRKNIRLKEEISMAKSLCANKSAVLVQEAIMKLPEEFHKVVNACFEAASKKNTKGRRYSLEWIYECLIIRLKSRNMYEFLRNRNIIPLPTTETLNKFIRKISRSAYGFQPATFYCLKERCQSMKKGEKRGVILVDEMKLSEGVYFEPQSMKFNGFVDLGQHTPEDLKNSTADQALVFKFVPFQGTWVQVLGCFLSNKSCKSDPLHKLILECIILMENSGIYVDAVVMDGAPWKRGVWKIFGVDENSISCEHPCDSSRRLWMISDFNQLVKSFRTSTLAAKQDEFKTSYLPHNLIQAMSSRIPRDALYTDEDCRQRKAILDFLQCLRDWERLGNKIPVSKSTLMGLKVTLQATLEILDMLNLECGYKYLLTATLSQDPLEKFFSVMRNSCGGNDHPDPKTFAQVYRMASCFSLICPPKRCNVSGTDLLRSLLGAKDVLTSTTKDKESWLQSIDNMLESGEPLLESFSADEDHLFNEAVTNDVVQSYIVGYLVRKLCKNVTCVNCLQSIQMNPNEGNQLQCNTVINTMDLSGGLILPSDELFNLTKQLEVCVLKAISKALTNAETINEISIELKNKLLLRVGCSEHNEDLTKKIVDMYIITRAHFLAKSENKRNYAAKDKTKKNTNKKPDNCESDSPTEGYVLICSNIEGRSQDFIF